MSDDRTQPDDETAAPALNSSATGPAGRGEYEVQPGDCFSSIAFEHGFFWETLWNHPDNVDLKSVRKSPHLLLPGDRVTIPAAKPKQVDAAPKAVHKFCIKGVPEKFQLRLVDAHEKPRANLNYILEIDGISTRGTTDADGQIHEPIPPNARAGKLVIDDKDQKEEIALSLGELDPVTETTGIQMRLLNLGFDCGEPDGIIGPRTKAALARFQKAAKLDPTGEADDATRAELEKRYGC